jgi:hypothetical protein
MTDIAAIARRRPTECPKCSEISGDDWSQCKGRCPMPMSPHNTATLKDRNNG